MRTAIVGAAMAALVVAGAGYGWSSGSSASVLQRADLKGKWLITKLIGSSPTLVP